MKVAGKTAKQIEYAKQGYRVVTSHGVEYKVDWWLNDDEAARKIWTHVTGPKYRGGEEKIELPSELSPERFGAIIKEISALEAEKAVARKEGNAAAIVPADEKKLKKLDPGIYLDEDTGKYFKIDKDGSMTELEANEAP